MAALECPQSYLSGQGSCRLLGWSEDEHRADVRRMAAPTTTALIAIFRGMAMLPHCILGGASVDKAANSEPEQVMAPAPQPVSVKE